MGGRGASSGASIKTVSYENITKQQQSMKYLLNMQKTITISEKGYVPRISNYKNMDYTNINEAIVEVPKGDYERRIKMLKEKGYNIVAQTKLSKDAPIYSTIKMHIRRK